jgi:hypothetical protein
MNYSKVSVVYSNSPLEYNGYIKCFGCKTSFEEFYNMAGINVRKLKTMNL